MTNEPTPTRKFMFDRSFDPNSAARAPERKPVTLKPEQYDALKKESYDAGFAAGRKAGLDDQTDKLAKLVTLVGNKIDVIVAQIHAIHKSNEASVRQLSLAIAKKFVPDLASRHGLQEIESMIEGVIGEMIHEPRLVVRVHESQFDALSEKINAITAQKAYTGKVVVLADSETAAGDCKVEWADGGMERNAKSIMSSIEETVSL